MTKPTIEFVEGFDKYTNVSDLSGIGGKWGSRVASLQTATITFPSGRFGVGKGLQFATSSIQTGSYDMLVHTVDDATATALQGGFSFHCTAPTAPVINILRFRGPTGFHNLALAISETGVLGLTAISGALLAVGTTTLGTEDHWIEYYVSTSGAVKIWLDGALEIDASGLTVLATGQGTALNAVAFGLHTNAPFAAMTAVYDDMYIGYPADANTPLGDSRVETFIATSTTTPGAFSIGGGAASLEVAVSDWVTTTWAYTNTLDDEIVFDSTGVLHGTPDEIHAVCVNTKALKEDAGTRTFKTLLKDGTDTIYSPNENFLSTSIKQYQDIFTTQPDGTNAWDKTSVEAAKFGLHIEQ